MAFALLIATLCTVIASLPVLVHRSRVALNPAFWVLLTVMWGVSAKTVYVALVRNQPLQATHDKIWVSATSPDYFLAGLGMALAAVSGYVAGYFLIGGRHAAFSGSRPPVAGSASYALAVGAAIGAACVLSFIAYLYASGTDLWSGPFSAKRFLPRTTAATTRFQYMPYYFFKLALSTGPLAFAAAFCAARSPEESARRRFRLLFVAAFLFTLLLCHFASLRLIIGLLLLQISLLVHYLRARELKLLTSGLAVVTVASLAAITFVHRPQRNPDLATSVTAAPPRIASEARPGASVPESGRIGNVTSETGPPEQNRPTREAGGTPSVQQEAVVEGAPGSQQGAMERLWQRVMSAGFEGRYALDMSKLAHLAHHFPETVPHLRGGGLIGSVVTLPEIINAETGERIALASYLGHEVFAEPSNSIPPGLAGELYIDFGIAGVIVGFFALGVLHRLVFNQLIAEATPPILSAGLVILLLNSTLVLVNTGFLAAASRSVLEIAVLTVVCVPWIVAYAPRFSRWPWPATGTG